MHELYHVEKAAKEAYATYQFSQGTSPPLYHDGLMLTKHQW